MNAKTDYLGRFKITKQAAIWLLAFSLLIIANDTYLVFSGVSLLQGFHIVTAAFGLIALIVGTFCAWLLFSQKGHEVLVKPQNQKHGNFVLDIEQLYQVVKSSLILAIIIFVVAFAASNVIGFDHASNIMFDYPGEIVVLLLVLCFPFVYWFKR
jgi:hypothetical protein